MNKKQTIPLKGFSGKIVFSLLLIITTLLVFIIVSSPYNVDTVDKKMLLFFYSLVIVVGWLAFTAAENTKDFWEFLLLLILLILPIILSFIITSWLPFSASLAISIIIATIMISEECYDWWDYIINFIYITWVISGILISIGTNSFFSFAEPTLELIKKYIFYDVRYYISALMFILLFIKAFYEASEEGKPFIPSIPKFDLINVDYNYDSFWKNIFRPFLLFLKVFILIVHKLIDTLWRLIANLSVFIYRIGKNLSEYFIDTS